MTREKESLSDPKAMRALAHPARLAILSRLGAGGSVTATDVAEEAGITPSAASYHLRMLAKYGFVEDAPPRGDGRERLWKAADKSFAVGRLPDDRPEVREAKDLLIQAFRKEADEEARRALAGLDREPEEWRDATRSGGPSCGSTPRSWPGSPRRSTSSSSPTWPATARPTPRRPGPGSRRRRSTSSRTRAGRCRACPRRTTTRYDPRRHG